VKGSKLIGLNYKADKHAKKHHKGHISVDRKVEKHHKGAYVKGEANTMTDLDCSKHIYYMICFIIEMLELNN
jgi:hypothetical protein